MSTPKVSVIIPVYNVEKYLEECIDSILNQSFADLEVILINDGSTDSSGEICELFSQKDSRIKVLHTQNQGVSAARNLGLSISKGIWITFIDADDSIEPHYFDLLSSSYLNPNIEFVIVGYKKINEKGTYYDTFRPKLINNGNVSKLSSLNTTCWGYFYLREYIEKFQIKFPENIKYAEDQVFLFKYLSVIKNYDIDPNSYYKYKVRSGSAMAQPYDKIRAINHLEAILNILEFHYKKSENKQIPKIISKGLRNLRMGFWYIQLRCTNSNKELKKTFRLYKQFENKASILSNYSCKLSYWKYPLIVAYYYYIKLKVWLVF